MKGMWDLILILVILTAGVFTQLSIVCTIGIFLAICYVLLNTIGRYLFSRELRRRRNPKGVTELLNDYDTMSYSPGQVAVKYFVLSCVSVVLFFDTRVLMGDWVLLAFGLVVIEIPLDMIYRIFARKRILRRLDYVTKVFVDAGLLRRGPHDFSREKEIII